MLAYKYRGGLPHDLAALEGDYFWSPKISDLNDPTEGLVDSNSFKPQLEYMAHSLTGDNADVKKAFKEVYESLQNILSMTSSAGIYALCKTYHNELLWAHYANSHKGYCIEYELDTLIGNKKYDFYLMDIIYSKRQACIELEDLTNFKEKGIIPFLQKLVGTKSESWSYEKEVRIVTNQSGKQPYDFRAIKGIYFGLRMNETGKELIMQCLKGRGIKYYQMQFEGISYQMAAKPVQDIYQNSQRYLYKIAPISNSIVSEDEVKDHWKPLIPYLYKAVEIARRDPYCSFVEYAAFSLYHSQLNHPIIYVHCEKTNGDLDSNFYYSLKDIDKQYSEINDLVN